MSVYDGDAEQRGRASIAVLTPITIPFGSLISIGRSPALTDLGNAAVGVLIRDLDRHEAIAPDTMRNRFRKQLTPPDKQLAWRDAMFARNLLCRPAGPRRFRQDPKLLFPTQRLRLHLWRSRAPIASLGGSFVTWTNSLIFFALAAS